MRRLAIVIVIFAACRARKPNVVPPPSQDDLMALGSVSAKLLPDPSSPTLELGPSEEYVKPQFQPGNPMPIYPADLVGLRLPVHVIAIRMIVDEKGAVSQVTPSPLAASTEDEYRPRFEESVKSALDRWYVSPPQIRKFKPGDDLDGDGKPDYRVMVASRTLKAFFDISFTFDIVDGKPVVRSASH